MKLEDINNLQKIGEVQTKLDSYKYYLKFKDGNPRDLAEILFWIIRSQYNTYYGNDKNILQCHGWGTRRSFEDIYRVAKYYITDVTLKDMIDICTELKKVNYIHQIYCTTVLKTVHYYNKYNTTLLQFRNLLNSKNLNKEVI